MAKSLRNRLAVLEDRLRPRRNVFLGSFEIHYTDAWPDCQDKPGSEDLQLCEEHGSGCRRSVTPQRESVHRSIVLPGPWVPLD